MSRTISNQKTAAVGGAPRVFLAPILMTKQSQPIVYLIVRELSDKKGHKLHLIGMCFIAEIKAQNV